MKSREVPSSSQPSTRPWLNKSLVAVKEQVKYSVVYHLDADPDADPDSTSYPDADPPAEPDSDFYLMKMRIHIRIRLFSLMRIGIRMQILASK